jgi:glycosyltransferase involved in cell wall biosynthesis
MRKIKILQFTISNARGGDTQYVLQNWKFIDKNRFQFDFVTASKTLDFSQELTAQGCKIHYLSCRANDNEVQFTKEINQILDEGYDAIHLHTSYWTGFLVEKLAYERNCPNVIIHSHNTMIDQSNLQKREECIANHEYYKHKLPLEYGTKFCACSRLAADWLFGEQIPRRRIQILHNAIDLPLYSFSPAVRKEYRQNWGLDGCFVLGHIGRFTYQKNHSMCFEIFRKVYQKFPHARLILIGDGELETNIRQQVKESGLESKVMFLGKRSDVPQLLQAIDLFLLPSRFEGLPFSLIEAQAAGLKCFTTTAVSAEAKITPNLEYLSGNVSEWVDRILQAADGYDRTGSDCFITQAGYDLRQQIKLIEKLYSGQDISRDCLSAADSCE